MLVPKADRICETDIFEAHVKSLPPAGVRITRFDAFQSLERKLSALRFNYFQLRNAAEIGIFHERIRLARDSPQSAYR
jgi:hypothetical protein